MGRGGAATPTEIAWQDGRRDRAARRRYPEPVKPSGRGSYEFSRDEGAALLRITRLMRQAALLLTLTGALTIVHSVHSAVTNSWQDFFEIFSVIDDVTISYYLLISASAFVAIADSHKRDTDFLLASLEALGRLWDAARIPLAMQLSYYVNACLGPWIYPPARAAVASGVETSKGLVAAVAGVLGSSQ